MYFTVNLAFWQVLKDKQPKLAGKVKPEYKQSTQTFDVCLYNNEKGPFEVPDKLKQVVGKLNEYRRPERKNVYNSPLIISKSQNNILVITSTAPWYYSSAGHIPYGC